MPAETDRKTAPPGDPADLLAPARPAVPAPIGGDAVSVRTWFDTTVETLDPASDGSLAGDRDAADTYRRMAKAANTRRAYRAAVRAWCIWCARHDVVPLPAASADVAAFLGGERAGRQLAPNTIDLRRAAIRYLHRAAGCPVPTDDACVAETVAGIRRDAARRGHLPKKKVAATATIVRRLLAPIPDTELAAGGLVGLRDRALILVGFAGALRRAELAAIRVEHLEKTERGIRLTLPQTKGAQTAAVTVPLPYGDTALCPVHALLAWLSAAGITGGAVFRRVWLPRRAAPGQPSPLPQIGADAITPQTVARIIQARALAAGFGRRDLGGHSLKRGAVTTGMDLGIHPTRLKRLGRHKSYDTLGEYLELGDLFDGHPLSGVL
ncbi:MAG: recombinase [Acetobacteraceae bacterium]|nr:recombinase [Acetobacteraceae bacterium]